MPISLRAPGAFAKRPSHEISPCDRRCNTSFWPPPIFEGRVINWRVRFNCAGTTCRSLHYWR